MLSLAHDAMGLTILTLTLVAALGAPSPSRAQEVLGRDALQDAQATFSQAQEEWREHEVVRRLALAGKAYIPDSYQVSGRLLW